MFPKSLVSNLWTLLWSVLYYQLCEDFLYGMLSRCAVIVFSVIVKVLSGGWRCFHLKSITIANIAGALLSYFLEPIYIFSVTIGQSHIASKTSSIEDEVMRVIHERILPLSNKLMDPFQVNKVSAEFSIHAASSYPHCLFVTFFFPFGFGSHLSLLRQFHLRSFNILKLLWPP